MTDNYRAIYDKGTLRRDNPVMLPPPRKTTKPGDNGTAHPRGPGMGQGSYPRYRTAKALEDAVNMYFNLKEVQQKPPTMPGLALALGFKSVASLRNYEEKEEYADIIVVARTRVEEWKNELLLKGGQQTNGVIFDLKNNHGWADKIEQKTTVVPGGSLQELLQALQGNVLRPAMFGTRDAEDAEFREVDDDLLGPEPTIEEEDDLL